MIEQFFNHVAPFAAIGFVGWIFAKCGLFSREDARSINRYVFYVALPILMFRLIANAPRDEFDLGLMRGYLISEVLIYILGFLIAYFIFKRERLESILIGMSSAFVNHVFFVLPVATAAYGSTAIAPIMSIVVIDSIILYAGTVFLLDVLTLKKASPINVLYQTFRNPHIIGILIGILFNFTNLELPRSVDNFTAFVSSVASPTAIFTLGLILGFQKGQGGWKLPITIALVKTIIHPLLALAIFILGFSLEPNASKMALLVAAGPCGALPFVLALHYKINERAIAQAILISSIISLFGLSYLI
ncbi:MAG: AEC family transporter [Rhizobiales bacterium]|nr:AEC family transporter [Hyphomicrobiales bacterium]